MEFPLELDRELFSALGGVFPRNTFKRQIIAFESASVVSNHRRYLPF
jgi:hypothetical protein